MPAPRNADAQLVVAVSTPAMELDGKFSVAPGGWFDPGDHPNVEIYYILEGVLHLSNPDGSDVVRLVPGDAALIPAFAFHHGYNFENEDVVIYWWVPGEMHTDVFGRKSRTTRCTNSGWCYERKPVVLQSVPTHPIPAFRQPSSTP